MTAAALLAPIPELLLKRSEPIVQEHGRAAFGSRAWEVFRRLDTLRSDSAVPVYIYASHPEKPLGPRITWTAVYTGHVDSQNGAYPGDPKIRPLASTDTEDQSRFWAVFWHVTDLQRLSPPEWIDVGDIRHYKTDKRYGDGFVPEGPIIVGNP